VPVLRDLVNRKIEEPVLWYWLILHLKDLKKEKEAIDFYNSAIKIWPNMEKYFYSALKI
jgi:hypothetical protein